MGIIDQVISEQKKRGKTNQGRQNWGEFGKYQGRQTSEGIFSRG